MDLNELDALTRAAREREHQREAAHLQEQIASFRLGIEETFGASIVAFFGLTFEPLCTGSSFIVALFSLGDATYQLSRMEDGYWQLVSGDTRRAFPVEWTCGEPGDAERQATNADRLFLALDDLRNAPVDDLPF